MADNRLDPDINLLGYWGLDEALETDNCLDGATNFAAADLVATGASGVQAGRVGAARQFNGSVSYATVLSARLRLLGDLTLMAWVNLASYNSGGSLLRTVVSCGGPLTSDFLLYGLYVDSAGRLVYKHDAMTGAVIVRTAPALIKTGQFYCIAVRRSASGPNQNIEFVVDNVVIPIADVTVNAVPVALPVPPPGTNVSAVFSIARSQRETDAAYWNGLLDEVSVHDIARPYQPYLRGAYYRVAIRNATSRLTAPNNIDSVSSADMGAGVRWWCYERDKDLYVVKESPLGFFGPETRLTQTGGGNSTLGGKPELIYDATTDTLLVLFVTGNRIFKLTAQSTDDPASINMPFTADTGGIIKALENVDGGAFANGGGLRDLRPEDITYINRQPVKVFHTDPTLSVGNGGGSGLNQFSTASVTAPSLAFMDRPAPDGFGLAVGPRDGTQSGYRIFKLEGGGSALLGNAVYAPTGSFFFFPTAPTNLPKFGHLLDADVAALWRFDEAAAASNLLDAGTHGRTLTATGSPPVITGQIAGGRELGTSQYFSATGDVNADTGFTGEVTVESWIRPTTGPFFILIYGGIAPGASVTTPFYMDHGAAVGKLRVFWHVDLLNNLEGATSSFNVPDNVWSHVAARRRHVAGKAYVDFFLNGAYRETFGPFNLPVLDGIPRAFMIGRNVAGAVFGLNRQDDTRVSFMQRSNSEILDSFTNGYGLSRFPAFGDVFYAEALTRNGKPSGIFTNAVVYRNFEPNLVGLAYKIGVEGDGTQTLSAGNGGGLLVAADLTYINRTPVKLSGSDTPAYNLGNGGGHHGKVTTSGTRRPGALAIEQELL